MQLHERKVIATRLVFADDSSVNCPPDSSENCPHCPAPVSAVRTRWVPLFTDGGYVTWTWTHNVFVFFNSARWVRMSLTTWSYSFHKSVNLVILCGQSHFWIYTGQKIKSLILIMYISSPIYCWQLQLSSELFLCLHSLCRVMYWFHYVSLGNPQHHYHFVKEYIPREFVLFMNCAFHDNYRIF